MGCTLRNVRSTVHREINNMKQWFKWYRRQSKYETLRWTEKYMGGHLTLLRWPIELTFFGDNAMRWAVQIGLPKTYFVARPTTRAYGKTWLWYAYLSPNATPQRRTWGIGPGLEVAAA